MSVDRFHWCSCLQFKYRFFFIKFYFFCLCLIWVAFWFGQRAKSVINKYVSVLSAYVLWYSSTHSFSSIFVHINGSNSCGDGFQQPMKSNHIEIHYTRETKKKDQEQEEEERKKKMIFSGFFLHRALDNNYILFFCPFVDASFAIVNAT